MFPWTPSELRLLRHLNTPHKIQDFLETIPINPETPDSSCLSPRLVLRERRAQCIEGAMLAAAALRLHGQKPLILDLVATKNDVDHVVAVFRQHGCWGAISKTNHAVLRYREPIYRTIRELALSFFHEYFNDKGQKNLRSYSRPVDLSRFDQQGWMTAEDNIWYIPEYLLDLPHTPLLTRAQLATLRLADQIERNAGKLTQY